MRIIKIYAPHKSQINQALYKSKKMTNTWHLTQTKLIISSDDLEEVEKIFKRLVTPFKIIK